MEMAAGGTLGTAWTLAALAATSPLLMARLGASGVPLSVWAATWAAYGAAALAARRPRARATAAVAVCGLALVGGLAREVQRLPARYHDLGYRAAAAAIAPSLAAVPPRRTAFVSPEIAAFAYYLFRTGRRWDTAGEPWSDRSRAVLMRDRSLRAYVLDPTRSVAHGWPDSATLAWLVETRREVTSSAESLAGRPIPLRVFVTR
jgi:hypothetical protein